MPLGEGRHRVGQARDDRGQRDGVDVGERRCRRAGAGRRAGARARRSWRAGRSPRGGSPAGRPPGTGRASRSCCRCRGRGAWRAMIRGPRRRQPASAARRRDFRVVAAAAVRYHRTGPSPSAHRGDAGCPASRPRSSSSTRASSRAGRTCSTCSVRCSSRRSPTAISAAASSSSHGTGWVERIVVDADDTSTYFTPLAITLNIDSFEHLEFETRPDQLLVYTLVQGDERVVVEFAPIGPGGAGRLAVRPASTRPSTPASSSRWSCSASKPARTSSGSGGPDAVRLGAGARP